MQSSSRHWSSEEVPAGDRTDAWEDILTRSYRSWQVPHRLPATFYAQVHQHDFAGAGLIETVCDPCQGRRTADQVRREDQLYVGVQLTTGGRERFKVGTSAMEVSSGDLVVWTTDQVVEFEVIERLHKVTLLIPWAMMRERMPAHREPPSGGKLESRSGVGSLLAVHLLALSNEIATLDERVQGSVSRSTLELLGIALTCQQSPSFDATASMQRRVKDYILQHLHQADLTPTRIAQANRISLRYLHMLFQRSGMTVSEYILNSRLEACKQALSDLTLEKLQIAQIAYHWGFKSSSHFCRTFKERYGCAPGDVRRTAMAAQAVREILARETAQT